MEIKKMYPTRRARAVSVMKQIDSNPKLDEKIDCRLEQNESGEWLIYIGKIGRPLPASIIEIVLWLKIKELEELLREKQK